ncbi:putative ser/Thr protein phosphatase family [Monocercomonoides exilis]|uniref:putative ser/Thr protein phosphatase family n=1 Tax=Monocercomonoides exilis TaxID=2049356 RepID=UPI00355AC612|nr:putative ser/Thr protein phosphatase family [Monocercomonoides exilis]|eukprot:MONOS_6450.1-p1 / transcript=MONOS_6450.1 / gene=MONOS_6450 / organism=Monocercomonoides_exilis_PA203 / gene_product=Ser / transcript_product=Ser / location=Mono_scaffold00203:15985-18156(+) / protein_length=677 / sequence_SO=supercontig / SO=protein_coding / is_pseudo=false
MKLFIFGLFFHFCCALTGNNDVVKFNIYHTNDVHGWVYGDKSTKGRDAYLADYQNLLDHKNSSLEQNEFLFAFDSGDWTQGTGLSDSTPIPGEFIFELAKNMTIDVMTPGNHELYTEIGINHIIDNVSLSLGERYVSGNVIRKADKKPMGQKVRVLNVQSFGKIAVFGFLFHFTAAADNVEVTAMADILKDSKNKWVRDVLKDNELRFVICVAHMPPTPESPTDVNETKNVLEAMHTAIREEREGDLPVLFLGGHDHKKHNVTENKDFLFESNYFFKNIGHITFSMPAIYNKATNEFSDIKFEYIETNVQKMQESVGIPPEKWETKRGKQLREATTAKYKELKLDEALGCSPKDYTPNASDKSDSTLYHLVVNQAYPSEKPLTNPNSKNKFVYTLNNKSLRIGLTKGVFTYDDVISVDPFQNTFTALRNVTGKQWHKLYNGEVDSLTVQFNSDSREEQLQAERAASNEPDLFEGLELMDDKPLDKKRMDQLLEFAYAHKGKLLNSEIKQLEWMVNGALPPTNPFYGEEFPFATAEKRYPFYPRYYIQNVTVEDSNDEMIDIITSSYDGPRIEKELVDRCGWTGKIETSESLTVDVTISYLKKNFICKANENETDPNKKKKIGIVVGCCIGGVVLVAAVIVAVICVVRHKRKRGLFEKKDSIDDATGKSLGYMPLQQN